MIDHDKNVLMNLRIKQSEKTLSETSFLIENKLLALAVNRIYYSIFYAISAVSIKDNFSTSKHKRLLGWFNKNYIYCGLLSKEYGKMIYASYENREKSDYDFLFEMTKEEIIKYFELAKEFVAEIKKLLEITNQP
ncbi:MAG: HEPN domain-containing protein [Ignavibacteriales bacterium]|nr:HEPN domain-containing protein [Ignavibacteriales bacterium]